MALRLHRVRPGFYVTEDGQWEIIQVEQVQADPMLAVAVERLL